MNRKKLTLEQWRARAHSLKWRLESETKSAELQRKQAFIWEETTKKYRIKLQTILTAAGKHSQLNAEWVAQTIGEVLFRFKAVSEDSTGNSINGYPYPMVEIDGLVSSSGVFYILSERMTMPKAQP